MSARVFHLCAFIVLLLLLCTNKVAVADEFDDGLAAFNRGDYATALKEFKKAADAGETSAQFNLGQMYRSGQGSTQDYQQAVFWYTKAAEAGLPTAQNSIGVMYSEGQGVPQDYIEAHKWYNLAAASATKKETRDLAVNNRNLVETKMSPSQVAEAQKLAREWKPKR